MRISARVDYAVRAALELAAAAPDTLTCDRIAQAQGIPARFLQAILGNLQHARLVTSQRVRDGGYRLALLPDQVSVARVMRVEQGFLAEVHGQRPEDVEYPGPAAELTRIWVAARESYRQVLERVILADVVAGTLPPHAVELVELKRSWQSFGVPAGDPTHWDRDRPGRETTCSAVHAPVWHDRSVTDCGALLVERLHVDLARVSSAACRAAR